MIVLQYVFLVLCFVQDIQAQRYNQSDYDVKLDRLEAVSYNKQYFRNLKAGFFWYNRTQRVINTTAYFLKNFTTDTRVEIQMYKFLSNEYRFFPVTINRYVCEALRKNAFGTGELISKYSNYKCLPKVGFYYIRNAIIDFSAFPPFIPSGDYKLGTKCYHGLDFILELHIYFSIRPYITKWEI